MPAEQRIRILTPEQAAADITTPASPIGTALSTRIAAAVAATGAGEVYVPSPLAALRWRQIRTRVLAGDRQGHIAWVGDSIPYGAASTGATNPKHQKNYPGRVRSIINRTHGNAGTGFTLLDNDLFNNPAWDPRFVRSGLGWTAHTFGPYALSCWRCDGGIDRYFEFTDVGTEFWFYTLASGAPFQIQIDGAAPILMDGSKGGQVGSGVDAELGYLNGAGSSINVNKIAMGALGTHTLRIIPATSDTNDLFLIAVEARVPTAGTFRVGNMSRNGAGTSTIVSSSDDANGTRGLPWIDSLRADLLVMALNTNDWQGQSPLVNFKGRVATIVNRQRQVGVSATGSTYAGGDAVLVLHPKPDVATLGGGAYINPSWDQYRAAMYELAEELDVCLIDFGDRWGGSYATANSRGLFADAIHPGDAGADDLAAGIVHALFRAI